MPKAVYFHIPFCVNICHYCDFNKVYLKGQPVDEYLTAMELEIQNTINRFPFETIETLFVGGGTPTALNPNQLDRFLKSAAHHFSASQAKEFTVEANPEQTTKEKLSILKEYGVNRLSIGVQTFHSKLLNELGRTHNREHVYDTIKNAKEMGLNNISVDLMFGLPGQTVEMFKETIKEALDLGVTHFSAYSLQVEPKTIFYIRAQKGKLILPTQDEEAVMYENLMEEMNKHGYTQYEISNFALPGYESKHNLQYWNNNEYYGIGAGSHSYVHGSRRINAGPLKKYMTLINETGFPYVEEHEVPLREKMEEELFMGLRKREGVNDAVFQAKFGQSMFQTFSSQIAQLIDEKLLIREADKLFLSHQGVLLGNEVFQEFVNTV